MGRNMNGTGATYHNIRRFSTLLQKLDLRGKIECAQAFVYSIIHVHCKHTWFLDGDRYGLGATYHNIRNFPIPYPP